MIVRNERLISLRKRFRQSKEHSKSTGVRNKNYSKELSDLLRINSFVDGTQCC